ncbi:MAG: nitroreductase family protein [Chlorobium sp.]|uniref:nitroreductase family protein n=1 Tax=Chlorobium sp. TaxID=1095 RepID=UPI0025BB8DA4|nr:nitroreductase family protein [Chlorobium sp.]MCF8383215.1 nitroreductase family protein [Chlorobium sp.]
MNETISTILMRRSVRSFRPDVVGQAELDQMIEAARHAPSAMNQQPWHFTAIRNPELLRKLEENCKSAFLQSNVEALREVAKQEGFCVFYHAPLMVIISGDPGAIAAQYDCTLAMENMMLAAASLGIGSCWTHAVMMFHATEKGKAIFRELGVIFPDGHQPYAAAVFGWPAEPYPEAPPKKADCFTIME